MFSLRTKLRLFIFNLLLKLFFFLCLIAKWRTYYLSFWLVRMFIFMHFPLVASYIKNIAQAVCDVLILCNHKSQILLSVSHKINKVHVYTYFLNMYFITRKWRTRKKILKNHSRSPCVHGSLFCFIFSFLEGIHTVTFIEEILQRKFSFGKIDCSFFFSFCFV